MNHSSNNSFMDFSGLNSFVENVVRKVVEKENVSTSAQAQDAIRRREESEAKIEKYKKEMAESEQETKRLLLESSGGSSNADEKNIKNGLLSTILKKKPNVRFSDVAGCEDSKRVLKEAVMMPQMMPAHILKKMGHWKGILLYGPPGTGKTMMAEALAGESNATFLSVKASDLISKWQGESEKAIKQLFILASENRPAIIFFDEVDGLASQRSEDETDSTRRIKTELFAQMDGLGNNGTGGIFVIATTNVPWQLDEAIRRRFQKRIYMPLPDSKARLTLLNLLFSQCSSSLEGDILDWMVDATEGFSGDDLKQLVATINHRPLYELYEAIHFKKVSGPSPLDSTKWLNDLLLPCSPEDPMAIRMTLAQVKDRNKVIARPINKEDLCAALQSVSPSVALKSLEKFVEFDKNSGSK